MSCQPASGVTSRRRKPHSEVVPVHVNGVVVVAGHATGAAMEAAMEAVLEAAKEAAGGGGRLRLEVVVSVVRSGQYMLVIG